MAQLARWGSWVTGRWTVTALALGATGRDPVSAVLKRCNRTARSTRIVLKAAWCHALAVQGENYPLSCPQALWTTSSVAMQINGGVSLTSINRQRVGSPALPGLYLRRGFLGLVVYLPPRTEPPPSMLFKAVTAALGRSVAPVAHSLFPASKPHPLAEPGLRQILVEEPPRAEDWIITAAVRRGRPAIRPLSTTAADLHTHAAVLRAGTCMPIGRPAFVRACLRLAGVHEPAWNPYPSELSAYMHQVPHRVPVASVADWPRPLWVKSATPAAFRGFLYPVDVDAMPREAARQLRSMHALDQAELVYLRPPLNLAGEWRYYILHGEVIGFSPASPRETGSHPPVEPDAEDVTAMIARIPEDAACALDIGALQDGTTVLVCVRDTFGLELYPFAASRPTPTDFLQLLWSRWSSLLRQARRSAANAERSPDST